MRVLCLCLSQSVCIPVAKKNFLCTLKKFLLSRLKKCIVFVVLYKNACFFARPKRIVCAKYFDLFLSCLPLFVLLQFRAHSAGRLYNKIHHNAQFFLLVFFVCLHVV